MDGITLTMLVRDAKLSPTPAQKSTISAYLQRYGDRPVMVRLSKPKKDRSTRQNAYMWSVVLPMIAEQTGHTTEEIHGYCKEVFLPRKFIKIGEREIEIKKTTVELTTNEFELYMEQIRQWAGETLGLTIPLPGES